MKTFEPHLPPAPDPGALYLHPDEPAFQRFFRARLATVGLDPTDVAPYRDEAVRITAARFATIDNKYYRGDARGIPLRAGHLGHTILFLYELSRQAWRASDQHLADVLYFLKVASGGCNVLYEIELPLRTYCEHPHGAVIGRGTFAPDAEFLFSTNCTIGNNRGVYPRIEGGLVMMPNAALLGATTIRGNVVMSNGSKLLDAGQVADVVVYGSSPNNRFKPLSAERYREISHFRA
jgi:serine O-acetyltransferase